VESEAVELVLVGPAEARTFTSRLGQKQGAVTSSTNTSVSHFVNGAHDRDLINFLVDLYAELDARAGSIDGDE
jgi:hypothetical protein